MQILVDADACPIAIREILFRAAERAEIPLILVANQHIRTPPSRFIRSVQVPQGFDVADHRIAEMCEAGDLIVTQDIPLSDAVIKKGATALGPRGELYTKENIGPRLSVRNFLDEVRSSGVQTGGPAALDQRDRQEFANQLDRFLARQQKADDRSV